MEILNFPALLIACLVDMANSVFKIYDKGKQEWTIETISKQVANNKEQNTIVFTNNIQNIIATTNGGLIHFLIDTNTRKIAPIINLNKKLMMNT